jgi:opacity protein-like surface antigen
VKRLVLLSLAAMAAAAFAGAAGAQSYSAAKPGNRAGHWEGYAGARYQFSETVDFDGGSTVDSDNDLGFAFGLGYNIDDHWLVGGEISWASVGYDGVLRSADSPGLTSNLSGDYDTFSLAGNVTYHFMDGPLTPYVSASLGYTWVDSNIATGPPQTGCWWDPWWGYICDSFVDTKSSEAGTYGLGAGVRWEFSRGGFLRASYDQRWIGLDDASGTPSFGGLHLDIGSKF